MSLAGSVSTEARGLPEVGERRLQPGGCVEARVVHDGESVQVTAWRCLRDDEELRAERRQTHHVLTLLRTGTCAIEQGRRRTALDPCTALLHRPGATYRTHHPHGHGDAGWSLAFSESVADELLRHGPAPRPSRAITIAPSALAPQVLALQRARLGRPDDPLSLEEASLDLLRRVLAAPERGRAEGGRAGSARPSRRRLAERAAELAGARFRERLRLGEVAAELGCSPCHLARVFGEERGTGFAAHVRELRLGFVIDALAEGREGLSELALEAGFSSHAHLSEACARATGWPPSGVREILGGRPERASKILKARKRCAGGR